VGSLRESVLLMLILHKDRTEHAATRMLAQMQADQKSGIKAYDEYVKIRYPYLENAKTQEKNVTLDALKKFVGSGPIAIEPLNNNVQSKLRKRAKFVTANPDNETTGRLMSKIGKSVPT
jgi:type VI protein secretion system component VasK